MVTMKTVVSENQLRRYIRQQLLKEARLLTELKDYANPKFADYSYNDYFLTPVRDSPGVVSTVPLEAARFPHQLEKMEKFYPGSTFRSFDLNPSSLKEIEKLVSLGLASARTEQTGYPDTQFRYRRGEEGSPASSWESPQDVPDSYVVYHVFGFFDAYGMRINHDKGEISMDLSFLDRMNRRSGQKPGSDPHRQHASYVIPSGDVTAGTIQDIKKMLKHVVQKDARDILDYPIVGNEKFYGMTVRDVLGQRGASETQRATDPSATDLVAYHGTSSKMVKDILSRGLRPGKSQYSYVDQVEGWSEGNVYLTISPVNAENYATRAAVWYGGSPTVLRVTIPDTTKIVADEDVWGEFKLKEPIALSDNGKPLLDRDGKEVVFTHIRPKEWPNLRDRWLKKGWVDQRTAAQIDIQVDREIKTNIKDGLKDGTGTLAYRGPIMPKFIEKWREYPKKSYGSENKLDQEKYARIRADVLAKMKRFDQD